MASGEEERFTENPSVITCSRIPLSGSQQDESQGISSAFSHFSGLRDRDVKRFCFLLKDVLSSSVASVLDLAVELKRIYCLEESDNVKLVAWLVEIVNLEGIEAKTFECGNNCPKDQSKIELTVTPYRQLLVKLDFILSKEELEKMKFLVADIIPNGVRQSFTMALELFEGLEHHGNLSAQDLSTVRWLLNTLPRKDLLPLLDQCFLAGSQCKVSESYGLRHLPVDYVERQGDVESVKKLLKSGQTSVGVVNTKSQHSVPGARVREVVGIKGMGGIGKTVLAQAVCWQIKDQRQVIWLTVGQNPDILSLLNTLAKVWAGEAVSFSDIASTQNWIRSKSAERDSLVVLDDVWNVDHAAAFDILEGCCQLFITTRNADVVRGLHGFQLHKLGLLKKKQARELLLKCAQKSLDSLSQNVRIIVEDILKECDGLPLALALVGSSLVDAKPDKVVDWKDRLDGLKEADLEEIRSCFPVETYPYENLLGAVEVSFRSLPNEYREKFLDFAIFPEDSEVPSCIFEMLWSVSARKARSILSFLERRSLIQTGTKEQCYVVHDMLLDYIRGRLVRERNDKSALEKAHESLLDKYRKRCQNGKWSNGPKNDSYFFHHLAFHLIGAGKECELESELLDFAWLKVKLEETDLASLLSDFRYLNSSTQTKEEIKLLKSSLMLSSNIVSSCKDQLGGQLLGRLKGYTENEKINELLAQTSGSSNTGSPTILPSRWCLTPPGGPLMRTLNGNSRTILSIIVTPDMKKIITGGADGTIRFWDYETGKELDKIHKHTNMVYSLALSYRTNLLVSGSFDCTVRVWDTDTLEEIVAFSEHTDWVSGVLITSSRKVISSSYDKTIKLWDINHGLVHTFEGHAGNVRGIALDSDERLLASGSEDKTVKIWNLQTLELENTLVGHSDIVYTVFVSGKYVVSGSEDTLVKIWNIEEGTEVRTLIGHTSDIFSVCVTPDGQSVVSAGDDKTVKVWSFSTGEELASLRGHSESIRAVIVTPDGSAVVSGSEDRTYKLWNLGSLQEVPAYLGHKQGINDLDISLDGRLCITASDDSLVKVWQCENFVEVCSLSGHEEAVLVVRFHPFSPFAVSGGQDCTVRIWNLSSSCETHCLQKHQYPVQALSFDENCRVLITGGRDNSIGVWDWTDQSLVAWLKAPIYDITNINVRSQSLLVGNSRHAVWQYSLENSSVDIFEALKIKQDTEVAEGGVTVNELAQEDGEARGDSSFEKGSPMVFRSSVCFGPDCRKQPARLIKGGKRLLLGSIMSASPLRCLDVNSGMDIGHRIDPNGKTMATALSTLNDDKEVLIGTDQGSIVRLELDSGEVLQRYVLTRKQEEKKKTIITAIVTSLDDRVFVTGSTDGELRLWTINSDESKLLKACQSRINGVCVLEGGCYAACDENGILHVVSTEDDSSLFIRAHQSSTLAISSCHCTGYLATGAFEYLKVCSVKLEERALVYKDICQICCPKLEIRAIFFLPCGRLLLSGFNDNTVRLWDAESGHVLKTFTARCFGVTYVSCDTEKVVACFENCSTVVWSLESANVLWQIQGHWGKHHVMELVPQSNHAVSDGFHYTLKRWEMDWDVVEPEVEAVLRYPHSNEVTALVTSPDGKFLITSNRDKRIKLWLTESGECVSEFYLEHSAQQIACNAGGRVCVGLSDGQLCFMTIVQG